MLDRPSFAEATAAARRIQGDDYRSSFWADRVRDAREDARLLAGFVLVTCCEDGDVDARL